MSFSSTAEAANKPCSGKKGGISHCSGTKFVCNNGTISRSKQSCSSGMADLSDDFISGDDSDSSSDSKTNKKKGLKGPLKSGAQRRSD